MYQREDVQSDGTFTDNVVVAKPGEEEEDIFGGEGLSGCCVLCNMFTGGDENMKDRDLALAGIEIG